MNTFIMLIMLLHSDPDNVPYTSFMQESPMRQYNTLKECEAEAVIKRESMLKSSLKYPDLGIVDIYIRCVDSSEAEFDPNFIQI